MMSTKCPKCGLLQCCVSLFKVEHFCCSLGCKNDSPVTRHFTIVYGLILHVTQLHSYKGDEVTASRQEHMRQYSIKQRCSLARTTGVLVAYVVHLLFSETQCVLFDS